MPLLKVENVYKTYIEGKIKTDVLKGINLCVEKGQLVAIVGQSGSGKSTLLHLIGTLDKVSSGNIFFNDINLCQLSDNKKAKFRNKNLGFVYQFHHLLTDFSALENVMIPLQLQGLSKKEASNKAMHYLNLVDLESKANFKPRELSGGQRQRVAIARALSNEPKLILADEPTGNLDEQNANLIFELFKNLVKKEQTTLILVTHDSKLAKKTDRVFCIKNGIIED